jgi:glycosyltransferase involved in cell wall biosynthesis
MNKRRPASPVAMRDVLFMSDQKLAIFQTCFSPSWGGLELQALELTAQLQRRGHTVTLACPPGTRLAREASAAGVPTFVLPVRGYVHPWLARQLARELRRQSIQLIHCQHSRDVATVVPAMLLSGARRPILLSKRVGSYLNKKDLFHRITYRYLDRILAISEVIHRNVLDTLPVSADRVLTLHDAIDTRRFAPEHGDRSKIRQEFGYDESITVVGFVGRFSPGKGHEELLQAAASLKDRFPSVHYLVVGEPSHGEEHYAERIHALVRELKIEPIVRFAGFRTDIPDVMASFDLFAFPSHAESFGIVLIEAMAMERPVVSTNCDGVLDIMVDGETGLMVPPRDAAAFADALARLLENPALRNRMGSAARRRVTTLFDQQRQLDRLEEIYRSVLNSQL